jgi:predicted transposase YbfD/YdcC
MGCQKEIVADIREQGGDYLLVVKDNHPMLHQDIKEYFEGLETGEIRDLPEDVWISEEKTGHREGMVGSATATDIDWIAGKKI